MIVGVAIRDNDTVLKLPRPARHCHCFWYLRDMGIDVPLSKFGVKAKHQGFYTHTGKYLDREQAMRYVKRIKQPTIGNPKYALFSEDLW